MYFNRVRKGMALICVMMLIGTAACNAETTDNHSEKKNPPSVTLSPEVNTAIDEIKQIQGTETAENATSVKLTDEEITISGSGCKVDGNCLKIKEAGTYEISGTLSNGSIYVNTDAESEVHLIFNGVTIHNETGAAVFCKKAKKVTITLADGTINTLTDGAEYVFEEGETEPDATLYAKHDLVINGTGSLSVTSAYGDAIKGKDSLYILDGTFVVDSADDGIIGRDLLYISGGKFTVNSASDALKATNDTDITLGNIVIDGGDFALTAGTDGIQAENILTINSGSFTIKTGGGSANASMKTEDNPFGGWGMWGGMQKNQTEEITEETSSAKGLKATNAILVTSGTFSLDTSDDALHSNSGMQLSGGEFEIASGDDGMHADETLEITGTCNISITKSYEGLEALELMISGGDISIVASDDGLNVAGGADGSGFGRPGAGMFGEGEGEVTISGGTLRVNANGDGLDSNGNLTIDGGTVVVFGPTGGGNGVLDYGGTFLCNGGTLLAVGGSDMAQTPADTSGQYSLAAVLDSYAQEGSALAITVNGECVISETVPKRFNYIVASGAAFSENAEVSVKVNQEECYAGTLTDVVTCFGFSGGMGGFGTMGGFGGPGNKGKFGSRGDKGEFGGDF